MIDINKWEPFPRENFICEHCGQALHDHIIGDSPPDCPNQGDVPNGNKTKYYKTPTEE